MQENGMVSVVSVVRRACVVTISRFGDGARGTRSPNAAFDIAKATATELAAVGINWNFAPVLDVISDHRQRESVRR
jgi:beta-N-acetylhexosaminidase